ncbi:MAG: hypothetical protein ACTSYF_11060, partial [Promethearchaeota archaeon]
MNRKSVISTLLLGILVIQIFMLGTYPLNNNDEISFVEPINDLNTSASEIIREQWLDNTDFSTQDEWFYLKGEQGDNSTIDANISSGQANYVVVGEDSSFSLTAGEVNSSTWYGWDIYNNSDFLLP